MTGAPIGREEWLAPFFLAHECAEGVFTIFLELFGTVLVQRWEAVGDRVSAESIRFENGQLIENIREAVRYIDRRILL